MPKLTYYRRYGSNMDEPEDPLGSVSVVDVYDIASEIGKECEKIIDQFGADAVTSLMPKVINALELLENLALKNERENTTLQELSAKIAQLENDKIEKAEYREKFVKEIEAIEEQWRSESRELVQLVSRLQEENRRLTASSKSNGSENSAVSSPSQEIAVLERLRALVDKQRDEIREKETELTQTHDELDNVKLQVERLTTTTRDLRRKQHNLQTQTRTLCDERADFLVQLQDQQRELTALRKRLGIASKQAEDLAKTQSDIPDLSNKAVYDLDDPNRPRFTTAELKDILHERNDLKARLSDLEDELEQYKPKDTPQTFRVPTIVPFASAVQEMFNVVSSQNYESPAEEDAPVQGPLPYEPDDAPWKKSESGIRKFFRKLFSENSSNNSNGSQSTFPRRSLSTLSRLALSANSAGDATV